METDLEHARILVVDDDPDLRFVLLDQLAKEGVGAVEECDSITPVPEKVVSFQPDLILLDVQLPDGSGFDLCQRLRDQGFKRPILMLTGRSEEEHVITGLERGANDYISKPLRMGELLARIRSHLRQFKASDDARFVIKVLDFIPTNKMLHHQNTQQQVPLTEKETLILKNLLRAHPDAVAKEALLTEVWGFHPDLSTHTLETHIYRLRQKIRRITDEPIIETADNGYRLAD